MRLAMSQRGSMTGKSIIDKVMSDCKCNAIDDVPQKYTVKYPFRHRTTQVKPLYCHKHHYDERH